MKAAILSIMYVLGTGDEQVLCKNKEINLEFYRKTSVIEKEITYYKFAHKVTEFTSSTKDSWIMFEKDDKRMTYNLECTKAEAVVY